MFVNALEKAAKFTKPIHFISRVANNTKIDPGAATLFLVNDEGYALTCKHVAELIIQFNTINDNYTRYKAERELLPKDNKLRKNVDALKTRYKIFNNSTIQTKILFVDCVDNLSGIQAIFHPVFDLAIVKFEGFTKIQCDEYPVFKGNSAEILPGQFMCRLGFPFPEFNNFQYNSLTDDIDWQLDKAHNSPRFPIEGMITRFLGDDKGDVYGIEMSTPGLRGQSGGPLVDRNGVVCGMQSKTKHLHLGFDIENLEMVINGVNKRINDYSFIHLGECIHVDIIKNFLKEHNVRFSEQ